LYSFISHAEGNDSVECIGSIQVSSPCNCKSMWVIFVGATLNY